MEKYFEAGLKSIQILFSPLSRWNILTSFTKTNKMISWNYL